MNSESISDKEHQPLHLNNNNASERTTRCRQNCTDCSNVFKAFIGSAMVGMPFAVHQAGIVLSLFGIFVIAVATDHCCNLIVRCKRIVIKNIVEKRTISGVCSSQIKEEELILNEALSFGVIGKACLGLPGVLAVNISIMITQFGFSVGYFIFLGNTLRSILKPYLIKYLNTTFSKGILNDTILTGKAIQNFSRTENTEHSAKSYAPHQISYLDKNRFDLLNLTSDTYASFAILIFVPVIILISISFVRELRKLGPISMVANFSIVVAFAATASYMLASLHHISPDIKYFKLSTFPIFFGQLTGAFEGIGTVIPIEGSMGYNRSRYPAFLHCALFCVSIILASFGIIGYISFGENTCQIITANLEGIMATVLQILLFVGVLFTYPLQIYPCIQITEGLLIKYHKWRQVQQSSTGRSNEDKLLIKKSLNCNEEKIEKKMELKIWEGNLIRVTLVLMTAVIGLVFRAQFAYIAALNGSVGSSLLVYILPPVFHMSLKRYKIKKRILFKNIALILFGVISGVIGLMVAIRQIIESFGNGHSARC